MNTNPLVGYTAIAPDGQFLADGGFSLIVGPSRRAWLQSYLEIGGMRAWRIFPVFVNYLEPAIESGARGELALDEEAFRVFDPIASAKKRQPAGTFLYEFAGERVQHTFFIYGRPMGLN